MVFLQRDLFRAFSGAGVQKVFHGNLPFPCCVHDLVVHLVRDGIGLDPNDIRVPDDIRVKRSHVSVNEANISRQMFLHRLLPHIMPTKDDSPLLHLIWQAYADVVVVAGIGSEHDFPETGEFSPLCGHLLPFDSQCGLGLARPLILAVRRVGGLLEPFSEFFKL